MSMGPQGGSSCAFVGLSPGAGAQHALLGTPSEASDDNAQPGQSAITEKPVVVLNPVFAGNGGCPGGHAATQSAASPLPLVPPATPDRSAPHPSPSARPMCASSVKEGSNARAAQWQPPPPPSHQMARRPTFSRAAGVAQHQLARVGQSILRRANTRPATAPSVFREAPPQATAQCTAGSGGRPALNADGSSAMTAALSRGTGGADHGAAPPLAGTAPAAFRATVAAGNQQPQQGATVVNVGQGADGGSQTQNTMSVARTGIAAAGLFTTIEFDKSRLAAHPDGSGAASGGASLLFGQQGGPETQARITCLEPSGAMYNPASGLCVLCLTVAASGRSGMSLLKVRAVCSMRTCVQATAGGQNDGGGRDAGTAPLQTPNDADFGQQQAGSDWQPVTGDVWQQEYLQAGALEHVLIDSICPQLTALSCACSAAVVLLSTVEMQRHCAQLALTRHKCKADNYHDSFEKVLSAPIA